MQTKGQIAPHMKLQAAREIFGADFLPRRKQKKKNYWLGGFRLLACNAPKARLAGGVYSALPC